MRVRRPLDHLRPADPVSPVPDRVPKHPVAPDGLGETQHNGSAVPPTDLHIALVVPDRKTYELVKRRVHVVNPPYWTGRVHLHAIVNPDLSVDDAQILQAVVDLGWTTPEQAEIGPPAQLELGYQSEAPE